MAIDSSHQDLCFGGEGLIVKHPGRGSFVKSRTDKITLEVDPAIAEFLRRIAKEHS